MQAEQKLSSTAVAPLSDYDAIRETIQHYIAGGKTGNSDEMKLAVPQGCHHLRLYWTRLIRRSNPGTIRLE